MRIVTNGSLLLQQLFDRASTNHHRATGDPALAMTLTDRTGS
jgi:hypothetical protein